MRKQRRRRHVMPQTFLTAADVKPGSTLRLTLTGQMLAERGGAPKYSRGSSADGFDGNFNRTLSLGESSPGTFHGLPWASVAYHDLR